MLSGMTRRNSAVANKPARNALGMYLIGITFSPSSGFEFLIHGTMLEELIALLK
jgi:hypothetical protein